jgi:hypothetical protein
VSRWIWFRAVELPMSLRKRRCLTPASLAARRADALKSTGPRTERGKARVALNPLKHGRRAVALRDGLAREGEADCTLFDAISDRSFRAGCGNRWARFGRVQNMQLANFNNHIWRKVKNSGFQNEPQRT